MRHLLVGLSLFTCASVVSANDIAEFNAALAKWQAAAPRSYTFTYQSQDAVVVAPKCASALIRVRVKSGVGLQPVVQRGTSRCPKGTRGAGEIGLNIPATIEDAFEAVRRYVLTPPTPAKVTVAYDEAFGFPASYSATKLEIPDNDEGFKISNFAVAK